MMINNLKDPSLDPPYTITREESERLNRMCSLEEILMMINKLPLFGIYDDTTSLVTNIKEKIDEIRQCN